MTNKLIDNDELMKEWNYNKNININPNEITTGSHKKVWWKCNKCEYEWQTTIYHRAIRKSQCPACRNKIATSQNNLSVTHPKVLKKWNYIKNTDIRPQDVTYGSNKKVWWKCENGHEYLSTVNKAVNGGKCPFCCGQKVLVGFNDLNTVNPNLAKEWHPERNTLKPTEVTRGSSRFKVWWLCPKGHEYQATVSNRSNGTGCPICDKELKTSFPEQAIYYYLKQQTDAISRYQLNGKTEIDIYLPSLKVGIEYDGLYFHTGKTSKEKENKKDKIIESNGINLIRVKEIKNVAVENTKNIIYCKYDAGYKYLKDLIFEICEYIFRLTGIRFNIDVDISRDSSLIYSEYIESEKENSLVNLNPTLVKEWHPTLNGYIKPDMVSCSSGKKVWWLGTCGHEWQASVDNRNKGNGCPICSGHKLLIGFNDLATTQPKLLGEWDFEKNTTITPTKVTKGSRTKVWWKCKNNHSYECRISNRVHGKDCPICAKDKAIKNKLKTIISKDGSFAENYSHLLEEWNYEKNNINPHNCSKGSDLKVWWTCRKGHDYECTISNKVNGRNCPICAGKKILEGYNDLKTISPELAKEWNYEKNIDFSINEISPNSHFKVWWKCLKCNHEWIAQVKSRNINGVGCPLCAKEKRKDTYRKKMIIEKGSFADNYPELLKEWDYDKNNYINPNDVSSGADIKVWWKCTKCNHNWESYIYSRTKGHGCPKCSRIKKK